MTAYVDAATGMVGILLTQCMMTSPAPSNMFTHYWTAAYGSLE